MTKRKLRSWIVGYRATVEGQAVIDAETAEAAVEVVNRGNFDFDPGQEMTDWKATSEAEANE